MKRLIASALVTVFSVLSMVSPVHAADRFVSVDISEPSTTSNRTLNIDYSVFSTLETDKSFGVQLYENSVLKGTQEITHPHGDSGVFNISLPATGTYSYFVRATNHDAEEDENNPKNSKTVTVQITNAPEPTVTTVFVNNGGTNGTGGAGGQGGGAGGAGGRGSGQTAGATAGTNGQVTDQAASTDGTNNKDVLGSETNSKDNKKNSNKWAYVGVIVVVLLAGSLYYVLVLRKNNQA